LKSNGGSGGETKLHKARSPVREDHPLPVLSMNEVRTGLERLQGRISRERMSEADFIAAIAEIVAGTPADLAPVDGLLIGREIRAIEQEWKASLKRSLS